MQLKKYVGTVTVTVEKDEIAIALLHELTWGRKLERKDKKHYQCLTETIMDSIAQDDGQTIRLYNALTGFRKHETPAEKWEKENADVGCIDLSKHEDIFHDDESL